MVGLPRTLQQPRCPPSLISRPVCRVLQSDRPSTDQLLHATHGQECRVHINQAGPSYQRPSSPIMTIGVLLGVRFIDKAGMSVCSHLWFDSLINHRSSPNVDGVVHHTQLQRADDRYLLRTAEQYKQPRIRGHQLYFRVLVRNCLCLDASIQPRFSPKTHEPKVLPCLACGSTS